MPDSRRAQATVALIACSAPSPESAYGGSVAIRSALPSKAAMRSRA